MNRDKPIGISNLSLYLPRPHIDLNALLEHRIRSNPSLERRLRRALSTTGQLDMRFPEMWQDNSTLAAQSAHDLLTGANAPDISKLRYISVGTETPVDHSKPVAAYVEGMLQRGGLDVPTSLSTSQVQHACAGGTIAMMSVGALLQLSSRDDESGVVICSDIARYDAPSTAEITQGAGAVALSIENNPKLLELDLATPGYSSKDVDDFFRPLGSATAKVKGGYSVQCYHEALDAAFLDHCARRDTAPADVLAETDMFVVHVPFYRMAITAMTNLLSKHLGGADGDIERFLVDRGFYDGLEPTRYVGNIYSGSAYMALMFQLAERYNTLGNDIAGKNVLLASYGSGNTMLVLSMRIADDAPQVIAEWEPEHALADTRETSIEEYEAWLGCPLDREEYARRVQGTEIPRDAFYLASIREDGYREYRVG